MAKGRIGLKAVRESINDSNLIALVDWSNFYNIESIWQGLIQEVLPFVPKDRIKRKFFFDLADPGKRSLESLASALEQISAFSRYGEVSLGLNVNETERVHRAIKEVESDRAVATERGLHRESGRETDCLERMAKGIFQRMSIAVLVIHTRDRCLAVTRSGVYQRAVRLLAKPKITTGAGDHFNAGYCLGLLLNCSPDDSMLLGMSAAEAFVKEGTSPTIKGLLDILQSVEE